MRLVRSIDGLQIRRPTSGLASVGLQIFAIMQLVNILHLIEVQATTSGNETSGGWKTNEHINIIEADDYGIYLLGLFDIHQSNPRTPFKCGPIDIDAGEWQSRRSMQNMEAFLWAIEQVNADSSLLPGVKLGSLVLDTCSSFLRTNQQLANLLHESTSNLKQPIDHRQIAAIVADNADWQSVEATISMASALGLTSFITQSRSTKLSELARKYGQNRSQNLALAEQAPPNSAPVYANEPEPDFSQEMKFDRLGIGKMLPTDDLLFSASVDNGTLSGQQDPLLQNEQHHNKLLMVRMLLGNELLAESIGALVQQMGWDMVSLVYDDEPDMVDLHDELARQLFARNIQLALDEQVLMGPFSDTYDRLLVQLAKKTTMGAKVVIALLSTGSSRQLLDSLRYLRSSQTVRSDVNSSIVAQVNSLLWVTVADREPYYSYATDALGTISISSAVSLLPDFKAHFDELQLGTRAGANKWWPEYMRSILERHRSKLELLSDECTKWTEPKSSPLINKCRSLSLNSLVQLERQKDAINQLRSTPNSNANGSPSAIQSGRQSAVKQSSKQQVRLNKYLAGGWEHNGMDVINSVLAVANGLESLRQTLCPDFRQGICARMRQLISSSSQPQSSSDSPSLSPSSTSSAANEATSLPTMSELMYNELLRYTFQLADGRMFILDDFAGSAASFQANGGGIITNNNNPTQVFSLPSASQVMGQLETQLKLYNLRYLQTNSIGFVKFAHFDQQDGLSMNISKARHYPVLSFAGQVPLEQVKSSCSDENKCIMLATSLASQLANGILLVDNASSPTGNTGMISEEELAMGVNSLFKLDHPLMSSSSTGDSQVFAIATDSHKQTAGFDNTRQLQHHSKQLQQQQQDPLIHTMRSPPSQFTWQPVNRSLSIGTPLKEPVDGAVGREMFNVIALLPLHQLAKPQTPSSSSQIGCDDGRQPIDEWHSMQHLVALAFAQTLVNSKLVAGSSASGGANGERKKQIELTTTVIDYCGQAELASVKLEQTLASSSGKGKPVAIIDFDSAIDDHLVRRQQAIEAPTIHLSLGQARGKANQHGDAHLPKDERGSLHHLSLLPSKSSEIKAIVRLISSMPQWKLVHLIYTDHHHYRDEFVRRANEANLCVSKLIWIPQVAGGSARAATLDSTEAERRMKEEQLAKTRQLFEDELYDYQQLAQNSTNQPDGLNATRVLVFLASQDEATNFLVLESASKSMLKDYVWVSSHEWLKSVELTMRQQSGADLINAPLVPLNLLSTRLESFESHAFRRYFAQLTPSLHSPIPTVWFDQFWQQHFNCKLPISSGQSRASNPAAAATSANEQPSQSADICQPNERLKAHEIIEDERVHFVIKAIESIHSARLEMDSNETDDPARRQEQESIFVSNFKQNYQQSFGSPSFHIVHRLLASSVELETEAGRRQNSRHLSDAKQAGQLVRVGSWRDGQLILMRANSGSKQSTFNSSLFQRLNRPADQSDATADGQMEPMMDPNLSLKVVKSLSLLATIKSRCQGAETCNLCRKQVAQTLAMVKQEEARLRQSQSSSEPKAISSMESAKSTDRLVEMLPEPAFDDDGDTDDADKDEALVKNNTNGLDDSSARKDDIQAQATSLFDSNASKQVEQGQQGDIRRAYGHMLHMSRSAASRWSLGQSPMTLNLRQTSGLALSLLSLLGIICMLASMTYLYPNMLERKQDHLSHLPILAGVNGKDELRQDGPSASGLNNINDYFLLTGLLMLYSINIAFLLPTTIGVCWFRRVGLATSYTVIFSAILVKVLTSCHFSLNLKRLKSTRSQQLQQQQLQLLMQQRCHQVDPIDENVELTFESLPNEPTSLSRDESQQYSRQPNGDHLSDANQQSSAYQSAPQTDNLGTTSTYIAEQPTKNQFSILRALTISIGLVFGQIFVSLVWLIRQPPEPTLYQGFWHCSSPSHSSALFLYEPLFSLLYPALILFAAWIYSIKSFCLANHNDEQYRIKRPLGEQNERQQQFASNNPDLSQQINYQLKDAQSLVMTSTLLMIAWSSLTLYIISTSQQLLPSSDYNRHKQQQQHKSIYSVNRAELYSRSDDLTLVYANILSGAIVFSFLFIYRLHLFNCSSIKRALRITRSSSSRTLINGHSVSSLTNDSRILKYNQTKHRDSHMLATASHNWLNGGSGRANSSNPANTSESSFATQQLDSGQERLRMHQFSSYGTYSATPYGAEHYNTSSTFDPANWNRVDSSAKQNKKANKKRHKASPGLFFRATSQNKSELYSAQNNKLQRRQSSGSMASSTVKLFKGELSDTEQDTLDDTISCASSVASSSTSQLQGNDLYPIDCSLQLFEQSAGTQANESSLVRSVSFSRRSLRRSVNRLGAVREESQPIDKSASQGR